jgi:putative RNA 2'-phosphotransferase
MATKQNEFSKWLCYILRHDPDSIGLELDNYGWADTAELIKCAGAHGRSFTIDDLIKTVAEDEKGRYTLDADHTRIKCNYGHSIPVLIDDQPKEPPDQLYHGTSEQAIEGIATSGIQGRARQFVHLSEDEETAWKTGGRHGKPVLITIDTRQMHGDGHLFYKTASNVWLVGFVHQQYIREVRRK